jgi:hypothetical protein
MPLVRDEAGFRERRAADSVRDATPSPSPPLLNGRLVKHLRAERERCNAPDFRPVAPRITAENPRKCRLRIATAIAHT